MSVIESHAPSAPADSPADHIRAILERQRTSFLQEGPPSLEVRRDRIDRAIDLLVTHQARLCDAVSADFGHRSRHQTLITDIYASVEPLKHARKQLRRWLRPERRKVQFPLNLTGTSARVHYQPLGVVGAISPWNFPIYLTFVPLSGIFAAGNRVMIKPSELTPATSALMKELIEGAYDETEAAVLCGGPEVGAAFSSMPFDHLLFTGSTSVGRHFMRAAAENLTPVTLELGGKSPVIVSKTADLAVTADRVMSGKCLNAGQICLAPDYVFVHRQQRKALADEMKAVVSRRYPTLVSNPDYTSVINERHYRRLQGYLEDAREKGATIIELNPGGERFDGQQAHKLPPTLVLDATDDMQVLQDEIFGPILPIVTYERIDEVIAYVNARPRPLALYWFGRDAAERNRVLSRTVSGGVTVNDVITHVAIEDLPFGGVGPSGMGTYHGFDGFKAFSHSKSIFNQSRLSVASLMTPPYGARIEKILAQLIKR